MSTGLATQEKFGAPPPAVPVPQAAPPPIEVEFEGTIYEFGPDVKDESITRWFDKNFLAKRRKLSPEQAQGRSQWVDAPEHEQMRASTPLGPKGREEWAQFLSTTDKEGKPIVVKPEQITPQALAEIIAERKKFAAEAAKKENVNPVWLRELNEDTTAMERDFNRPWEGEHPSEYDQRIAEASGVNTTAQLMNLQQAVRERAAGGKGPIKGSLLQDYLGFKADFDKPIDDESAKKLAVSTVPWLRDGTTFVKRLDNLYRLARRDLLENVDDIELRSSVPNEDRALYLNLLSDLASKQAPKLSAGQKFDTRLIRGTESTWTNLERSVMEYTPGKMEQDYRWLADRMAIKKAALPATGGNFLTKGLYSAAEMAPPMVLSALTTKGTGLVGQAAFWASQEAPGLIDDLRKMGASETQAKSAALIAAPIIGAVELWEKPWNALGLGEASKAAVRTTAKKAALNFLKSYGKEWGEEGVQTGIGYVTKEALAAIDKDIKIDRKAERESAIAELTDAALALPWMMGPGHGTQIASAAIGEIPKARSAFDNWWVKGLVAQLESDPEAWVSRTDAKMWERLTGQKLPSEQKARTAAVKQAIPVIKAEWERQAQAAQQQPVQQPQPQGVTEATEDQVDVAPSAEKPGSISRVLSAIGEGAAAILGKSSQKRLQELISKVDAGGAVSDQDAVLWEKWFGTKLPSDQQGRTEVVREELKARREAQDASAVRTDQGVVEEAGQVGGRGPADRGGNVREPGQGEVRPQPTGQVPPAREEEKVRVTPPATDTAPPSSALATASDAEYINGTRVRLNDANRGKIPLEAIAKLYDADGAVVWERTQADKQQPAPAVEAPKPTVPPAVPEAAPTGPTDIEQAMQEELGKAEAEPEQAPAPVVPPAPPAPPTTLPQTPPKIGKYVNWTSNGVNQFTVPKQVTGVSEDGSFLFVEGEKTGIPASEATAVDETTQKSMDEEQVLRSQSNTEVNDWKRRTKRSGGRLANATFAGLQDEVRAALKTLGLKAIDDLSPSAIKKAYFKTSTKAHPDKAGGSAEQFARVNEAYELLTNSPATLELAKRKWNREQQAKVAPQTPPAPPATTEVAPSKNKGIKPKAAPVAAETPVAPAVEPHPPTQNLGTKTGVGARKGTAEGLARLKAAKELARGIINNPDLTGKARADAIENARNLVGFLTANADTTKPLETDTRNGDQIAYTGVLTDDGFREFIYLEGAKAGQYGVTMTEEEREQNAARKKADEEALQAGFRKLGKKTSPVETPAPTAVEPAAAKKPWEMTQDEAVNRAWPPGKYVPDAPEGSVADLNGQEATRGKNTWAYKSSGHGGRLITVTDPVTAKRLDHQVAVRDAAEAGLPVPADVLEYYDLQPKPAAAPEAAPVPEVTPAETTAAPEAPPKRTVKTEKYGEVEILEVIHKNWGLTKIGTQWAAVNLKNGMVLDKEMSVDKTRILESFALAGFGTDEPAKEPTKKGVVRKEPAVTEEEDQVVRTEAERDADFYRSKIEAQLKKKGMLIDEDNVRREAEKYNMPEGDDRTYWDVIQGKPKPAPAPKVEPAVEKAPPVSPRGQFALPGMEYEAADVEKREAQDVELAPYRKQLEDIGGSQFEVENRPVLRSIRPTIERLAAETGQAAFDDVMEGLDIPPLPVGRKKKDTDVAEIYTQAIEDIRKTVKPQAVALHRDDRPYEVGKEYYDTNKGKWVTIREFAFDDDGVIEARGESDGVGHDVNSLEDLQSGERPTPGYEPSDDPVEEARRWVLSKIAPFVAPGTPAELRDTLNDRTTIGEVLDEGVSLVHEYLPKEMRKAYEEESRAREEELTSKAVDVEDVVPETKPAETPKAEEPTKPKPTPEKSAEPELNPLTSRQQLLETVGNPAELEKQAKELEDQAAKIWQDSGLKKALFDSKGKERKTPKVSSEQEYARRQIDELRGKARELQDKAAEAKRIHEDPYSHTRTDTVARHGFTSPVEENLTANEPVHIVEWEDEDRRRQSQRFMSMGQANIKAKGLKAAGMRGVEVRTVVTPREDIEVKASDAPQVVSYDEASDKFDVSKLTTHQAQVIRDALPNTYGRSQEQKELSDAITPKAQESWKRYEDFDDPEYKAAVEESNKASTEYSELGTQIRTKREALGKLYTRLTVEEGRRLGIPSGRRHGTLSDAKQYKDARANAGLSATEYPEYVKFKSELAELEKQHVAAKTRLEKAREATGTLQGKAAKKQGLLPVGTILVSREKGPAIAARIEGFNEKAGVYDIMQGAFVESTGTFFPQYQETRELHPGLGGYGTLDDFRTDEVVRKQAEEAVDAMKKARHEKAMTEQGKAAVEKMRGQFVPTWDQKITTATMLPAKDVKVYHATFLGKPATVGQGKWLIHDAVAEKGLLKRRDELHTGGMRGGEKGTKANPLNGDELLAKDYDMKEVVPLRLIGHINFAEDGYGTALLTDGTNVVGVDATIFTYFSSTGLEVGARPQQLTDSEKTGVMPILKNGKPVGIITGSPISGSKHSGYGRQMDFQYAVPLDVLKMSIGDLLLPDTGPVQKTKGTKREPSSKTKAKKQAFDDTLKELIDEAKKSGTTLNVGVNLKLVPIAAKLIRQGIELKLSQFKDFIDHLVKTVGREQVLELAEYLEAGWKIQRGKAGYEHLDAPTSIAEMLAEEPVPVAEEPIPEAEVVEEPAEPEAPPTTPSGKTWTTEPTETTGSKNVKTDELRERAGLGERVMPDEEHIEDWQAEAELRIAQDPSYAVKLAEEVSRTPRITDKVEDAVLQRHLRDLENRRQAGEDVRDEMITAVVASEVSGTEWGRMGRGRQVEIAPDWSMAGIIRQHLRSVNAPPTDEQMAKYEELADENLRLTAELDEIKKQRMQEEIDRRIAETKAAKPVKEAPEKKGTKKERLQRAASDAVANFKQEWATLWEMGAVADPKRTGEKWVKITKAAGQVVRAYADLGIDNFLEFMAKAKKDFGTLTADQTEAFKEAWTEFRSGTKVESPLGENPTDPAIGRMARDLMRWAVESGIEGREAVVDAVHAELASMGVEQSREDTMKAMCGYSDFRELPDDDVSVTVRGYRGELQQLLKLLDMAAGRAARRSGVEQRTPTDEERRLQKLVDEAKKRGGFVVTDPKRQLKSALDTVKTAANNRLKDLDLEITDLEKSIADKTPRKTLGERTPPPTDTALEELRKTIAERRKQRDELKAEYDKIFPPTKTQRIRTAEQQTQAALREIARLQEQLKQLREGKETTRERQPSLVEQDVQKQLNDWRERLKAAKQAAKEAELARFEGEGGAPAKTKGKKLLTDAQRLTMAEAMLNRQITTLMEDLAAGKLGPKEKGAPLTSPALEAKRARLKELKAELERAREASPEYQAKLTAKQNERYKKSLEKQLAFWEKRRDDARKGILPLKRKKKIPVDKEMLEKKYQIELVRRHARAEMEEAERDARGILGKALGYGGDLLDLSTAIRTGMEMSMVLRQGLIYSLGFPRQSSRALYAAARSLLSRQADFAHHDTLMQRTNHLDYVFGKLPVTASDGPLSSREELLKSRITSWLAQTEGWQWAIPRWATEGVLGFERAFRTYLNTMGADLYDYMKNSVQATRPGTWSEDDVTFFADAAATFRGRANIPHAEALRYVFWAPRWVWSGVQLATTLPFRTFARGVDVRRPKTVWKGDKATRLAIAKVYVRGTLGAAAYFAMRHVIYSLLAGDDEEKKPKYETDMRATKFGRMQIGETTIETSRGLSQLATLAARIATEETKTASGKIVPLTGEDVPYGADDMRDALHSYLDYKLSNLAGGVLDWIAGETAIGEKLPKNRLLRAGAVIGERLYPMTWRDIWDAEKELNVPQGTVAAIEAFIGGSVQTYGPRTTYRNATEEGRQELFEKFIENMEWDSAAPAYRELLTPEQLKQVDERRKEKRQDLAFNATREPPERKTHKSDKTFAQSVKEHAGNLEQFKAMSEGLTHDEAQQLLIDHYRRPNNKGKKGSERGDSWDSYRKRALALGKLYGLSDDESKDEFDRFRKGVK